MEANALALVFPIAALCLVLERFAPGRDLPDSRGWHARAALLPRCGYRGSREQLLGRMLAFRDVNAKPTVSDR